MNAAIENVEAREPRVAVTRFVQCAVPARSVQRFAALAVAALAHFLLMGFLSAIALSDKRISTLSVVSIADEEFVIPSVVDLQLPIFELSVSEFGLQSTGHETMTDWYVDESTILAHMARMSKTINRAAARADSNIRGESNVGGTGNRGVDGDEVNQRDAAFFGIATNASRIVYVVDASGSMFFEGRFTQASSELLESVAHLGRNQQFHVFLFHSGGDVRQFAEAFSTPTPENVEMLRNQLNRFTPTGKTDAFGALRRALQLRPDVIYFLTDGKLAIQQANDILELEKSGTVIHTIALQSRSGEQALQDIAAATNGQYRFVPAP